MEINKFGCHGNKKLPLLMTTPTWTSLPPFPDLPLIPCDDKDGETDGKDAPTHHPVAIVTGQDAQGKPETDEVGPVGF